MCVCVCVCISERGGETFSSLPQLSSCSLNKFFISSTLILGVALSIIAILPWIQKGTSIVARLSQVQLLTVSLSPPLPPVQPKSGLLQASVVTLYCTYLTWSAIATEPYGISMFVLLLFDKLGSALKWNNSCMSSISIVLGL